MKKLFLILSAILISVSLCFVSCADKKTPSEKKDSAGTQNEQETEVSPENTENEVFILENNAFEKALKTLIGKEELTEDDLLSIYYMAVTPSANGKYNLCVGFFNYIEAYYKELGKENPDPSALIPYAFDTDFVLEDGVFLENDLARFKNVEVFEFYDFNINDISFIKNYPNLVYGYFASNGIKDVSSLSDYNPEILLQLDLSGNPVSDWSPLKHLEDKVVVVYSPETGMSLTLKEFSTMTPAEAPEEVPEVIPETAPEAEAQPEPEAETPAEEEKTAEEIAKEIAENIDLGSLFE